MNAVKRRSAFELIGVALLVGSFGLSVSAQQDDPAAYQRVVDENIELRQEQARVAKENGELRSKNADLILDVQDLESKREQLAAIVAQLQTPEETKAELDRLRSERAALMGEVERLRQSLLAVSPPSTNPLAVPPAPDQGSSLFRRIEQENSGLRQQLAQEREVLQAKTKAYDALTVQASEYRTQLETLSSEFAGVKQSADQSKARETVLVKALEKMARQSFQAQEELARLKAKLAKLEGEKAANAIHATHPVEASSQAGASPKSGDDTGSLLREARKAIKANRLREAESLYGEALKKTPNDPRIQYNLGVLYGDYLKNPEKAVACYRKYLELAPSARDASQVRSWILDLEMQSGR